MSSNLTIIFEATSQALGHVPPSRVTSATYKIEDLTRDDEAADRVIGSGAADVPAWTITSSSSSGAGELDAARVATASTTGATIGAAASIVDPDGTRESFEIGAISTDAYVEATTALGGSFASSSTVYGIEITAGFPDLAAANEDIFDQDRSLRVVWTYTIDGAAYVVPELIIFSRSSTAGHVGAALDDIRTLYPDLPARMPDGGDLDAMTLALAEKVATDLRRKGARPAEIMTGPQGRDLLIAKVIAHAAKFGYAPGSTTADEKWRAETAAVYTKRLEAIMIGEPGEGVVEVSRGTDQAHENPSHRMRGPTLRM